MMGNLNVKDNLSSNNNNSFLSHQNTNNDQNNFQTTNNINPYEYYISNQYGNKINQNENYAYPHQQQ